MRLSWKLGRVAGIDLFLHPSALLVWFLVAGAFGGNLVDATPFVLALFASITLHELGHALLARQYGIATRDITLSIIGGMARLDRLPRSAGPELLIALAGPAVNLIVAATLWPVALVCRWLGLPDEPLISVVTLNLGLGLFNLLPIPPMDGGRILRALLSGRLGRARATDVSATVGQFLAAFGGAFGLATGQWGLVGVAVAVYLLVSWERMRCALEARLGRRNDPNGLTDPPAPPQGFRWATGGDGVWRLVPILDRSRGFRSP